VSAGRLEDLAFKEQEKEKSEEEGEEKTPKR
jgi:hypothetical protein